MSALHALLIGIDDYVPDRLPDGTRYPSLSGAGGDVGRMAHFLREHRGLRPETTRLLVSRQGEDGAPEGPPDRLPTYANIVAAFHQIAAEARPGDRVYVHYSGHGARTPTEYPGIKGERGQDESLVPCDIFTPGSRYLRDLELALLVRNLVDRSLRVTLVLDCCHAGGAMRGGARVAVARQVPSVARPPVSSAVVDPEWLTEIWQGQQSEHQPFRGLTLRSWLPVANYALFAACRPNELAFEYPFDGREPQGALTHWLLATLERSPDRLSCGEIHQRLVARIRGFFASQTPMFLGEGREKFLSGPTRSSHRDAAGPRIVRIDSVAGVLIDAGIPAGVRAGDRIQVDGAPDLVIRRVGATESWAQVDDSTGLREIEPGDRAEVFRLQRTVRLVGPDPASREADRALAAVREGLQRSTLGFVEVCADDIAPDLCVTVGAEGTYDVLDPGGVPFPNLRPLSVEALGAVQKLLLRLEHMAKYCNILTIDNPSPPDWLKIGLDIQGYDPGEGTLGAGAIEIQEGKWLNVRLVNRSRVRMDFAVLDLAPDYSVTQLLPKKGSLSLLPLDPGQSETVRIKGWLPKGFEEGNDVLKVFATQGAANFRWLELPPLERPELRYVPRGEPKSALDRLFSMLTCGRAKRGPLTPSEFPEEEWLTAQVEIRVRRARA
ncbi:MAG TPA: hypothetical protein DD490_02495 [Acidobacteria bacterium]|nr:hypothetical protein [Acidobacteriota bacterium]